MILATTESTNGVSEITSESDGVIGGERVGDAR